MAENILGNNEWGKVRDKLFPVLCRKGTYPGAVRREFHGMDEAVMVMEGEAEMAIVTPEMLEAYGVSENELFRQAAISGEKLMPVRMPSFDDALKEEGSSFNKKRGWRLCGFEALCHLEHRSILWRICHPVRRRAGEGAGGNRRGFLPPASQHP